MRGRRFVRPALILPPDAGRRRRVLAELDDKPWAAEDGEPWRATFRLEGELPAGPLELSVASDITVPLRSALGPTSTSTPSPGAVDAPVTPPAVRPVTRVSEARAPDAERLTSRLAASEAGGERERVRRTEAETALERQRTQARQMTAELARLRAELELARAAELEARETSALLDVARRDHHATTTRYEALVTEHTALLGDRAAARTELEELTASLRTAREELAAERAAHPELPKRSPGAATEPGHPPGAGAAGVHIPPPPRSDRPVNPSLRSNSWLVRLLALLVIAGVVFAVYLVLHSTVLG